MSDKEIVRANANRKTVNSPSFASYYTNDTQLQTTPWDLCLTFGVIANVDRENAVVTIENLAEVRMSPAHAKKLSEILAGQVRHYEESIGFIPMPPEPPNKEEK